MEDFLYVIVGFLIGILIIYLIMAAADGGAQGTASNIRFHSIPIVMPIGGTQVILLPR